MREQPEPMWTILVRGPVNEANGRYELPDHDPAYWEDAIRLASDAIGQGMFTAGHAAFYAFAPNTLTLGIGAARHFKFPIDIYNLNRVQPTDATRYVRVCTLTLPR